MATKTTFSGTVYGSIQDPRTADSFLKVMGCQDGSIVVAWGNALESAEEGDEIVFGGGGDGENGYEVMIDADTVQVAGRYIVESFFETLDSSEWQFRENGDVFAGLTQIGHIGDDGTVSTTSALDECGVTWDVINDLIQRVKGAV